MIRKSLASLCAVGLISAIAPVRAQEQGHEGHHAAATADSAKPQTESSVKLDQRNAQGSITDKGGMMDGGCKMMKDMHVQMGGMMPKGDTGPSSLAYNGIVMRMHKDMSIVYSGNADVDFVNGMLPHRQAAVDMAKTVLAFGTDPEVRSLAEDILKTQQAEISQMKSWLQKNNAK